MYANLETVGLLTGHAQAADDLVASLPGRVSRPWMPPSPPTSARPSVYYELDATNPSAPYTAGPAPSWTS